MNKIGMCFPKYDYENIDYEEFLIYLKRLKYEGLHSFDFYTSMEFTDELLSSLFKLNMKLTFHNDYKISLKYIDEHEYALKKLRERLDKANHNYKTTIVYHVPDYFESKYVHVKEMLVLFKKIVEIGNKYNFDILIETLSNSHPVGNHIGDDYSEILLFLKEIENENFGVCWDIGHTRLNNIEDRESLIPPDYICKNIKFTHVHNIYKSLDHLPLTTLICQDDEIKYLKKNNYNGIYSLEFEVKNLKENINVYIDSIHKLRRLLDEKEIYND